MNLANGRVENMQLSGNIVTSDGTITASVLEGGNLFNFSTGRPLRGTLSGFMTGNSGEGFVAGFKVFEEIANEDSPSNSVIGTTAFRLPQAISTYELTTLGGRGFAIIAPNTSNSGISIGKTPDFSQGIPPPCFTATARASFCVRQIPQKQTTLATSTVSRCSGVAGRVPLNTHCTTSTT